MRKKTNEEYVAELAIKNPNIIALEPYIDNETKIWHQCLIDGHKWQVTPGHTLHNRGCPLCGGTKKLTYEEYIERVHQINPNIEVVGTYITARIPVLHRCLIDGYEWATTPDKILQGYGCHRCGGNERYTTQSFVAKMATVNPDIVILGEYVDCITHILCECKKDGHQWGASPGNLLQGHGCPKCANKVTITHDEYVEQLAQIHPDIEVVGEYVNKTTQILHRCKIDGNEWIVAPYYLFDGHGCPQCAIKRAAVAKTRTQEQYIADVFEINPNIEVVGTYVKNDVKILHRCKIDSEEWMSAPGNILAGYGCPRCNQSHGERAIWLWLQKYNIDYIPQHKYADLLGVGGKQLSYDFYIPSYNLLIEYQGEFHNGNVNLSVQSIEKLEKQKEHDLRKHNYARAYSINLLEIWYWDFKNIDTILNDYLLNNTK